jgi:tetratricopeptide (TPR) repeat protein
MHKKHYLFLAAYTLCNLWNANVAYAQNVAKEENSSLAFSNTPNLKAFNQSFFSSIKYSEEENYSKSTEALANCIELNKNIDGIYFLQAQVNHKNQESILALSQIRKAIELSSNFDYHVLEWEILKELGQSKELLKKANQINDLFPEKKVSKLLRIESLIINSEWDNALNRLGELENEYGISKNSLSNGDQIIEQSKNQKLEEKRLKHLVNLSDDYWYDLGLFYKNFDKDKSIKAFLKAAKHSNKPGLSYIELTYLDDPKWATQAFSSYQLTISESIDLINFLEEKNINQTELEQYKNIVSKQFPKAYSNSSKDSGTKSLLKQLELKNENNPSLELFSQILNHHLGADQYTKAEKVANECLETFAFNPSSYIQLVQVYYQKKELSKAKEWLAESKDYITDRGMAYLEAEVYQKLLSEQMTTTHLKDINLNKLSKPTLFHIGLYLYQKGDKKDANKVWNTLSDLDVNSLWFKKIEHAKNH